MIQKLLTALILAIMISCAKPVDPNDTQDTTQYGGKYEGLFTQEDFTVENGHYYHSDTSYYYDVSIVDVAANLINVVGFEGGTFLTVSGEGAFEFLELNRTIYGQFAGDSLYLSSSVTNYDGNIANHITYDFAGQR